MGLRDEKEGERRFRFLLGEREREVSEGVKDLARASPRPGLLRPLPLPDPRRGGLGDLLGVGRRRRGRGDSSSSRRRRRGGVTE